MKTSDFIDAKILLLCLSAKLLGRKVDAKAIKISKSQAVLTFFV